MDLVLDLVDLSDVIGTEQALRLHDGPKRALIEHIIATESAFRQSHLKKAKGIQSKVSDDSIAKDTSNVLHEHQSALSASHEVKPWAPKYMLTIGSFLLLFETRSSLTLFGRWRRRRRAVFVDRSRDADGHVEGLGSCK